ncbi:DNA-binding protein RHL1 isoform X4 [Jatropha curcas]|uniref:DNA-binding protein RHL1 isoform X4 n=1 Tax=Jatropha curcas TaxID=180498 RepID=UPI0005FB2913|nr:DNA-binding protein RHL1 isoform X4 [Jatropha curcas]
MVKASAASSSKKNSEPDVLERKRLKKLALSNNLLSETPAKTYSPLAPSKTVLKHHGKDILRKSQRKNRFLFSFPGLLAPIASGGKIGELKDLGTKNPILYLHFPQLFGTIVYPKNRYLTMQFSRGGKNVMCEDNFDSMGQGPQVECDFKGGAGAMSAIKQAVNRSATKYEEKSPETEPENYSSDDKNNLKALEGTTPIQHSERTARKTFKSTDVSSGDDSVESVAAEEGGEEKKVKSPPGSTIVLDLDNEGSIGGNHLSPQIQAHAMSETKSKRVSESAVLAATSNENSHSNRGSLVQATISTLFNKARGKKKVEEKNEPRNSRISSSSKRKIDQAGGPRKRGKLTEGKKAGTGIKEKKEIYEVEDDDIEEFSSSTQEDTEGSDEDWEA